MLYLDRDALSTAKSNYLSYASRMETLKSNLENAVTDLKAGWKTDAGNAFFQKYDDEWVKNLTDYINVINHMSNNMKTATDKYQEVFDEADKLKL